MPLRDGFISKRKTSFIPAVSFDDVLDNFGGRVTSGRFSTTDVIALSSTRYAFTGRAWEPLALRIERRIEEGEGRSVQEVDFLLHALAIVIEDGCSEAEAAVGRLADSGWLMHWLQSAQEQDQIGCTTWCIISFLFKRPDGTSARVVGNAADGFRAFVKLLASDNVQLAGHIVELCRRYYPGVIFSTVENLGFGVLITRCLRIIADNVSAEQFFTSENILKHWRKLNEVLPEAEAPQRFEKLITDVCPASELASQIEKSDFKLDDVGLYSAICAAAPPNSFVSWCQHGLQGLETDTWMRELENYDEGLRFALSLLDRSPFTLSISFQDAIIGFARNWLPPMFSCSLNFLSRGNSCSRSWSLLLGLFCLITCFAMQFRLTAIAAVRSLSFSAMRSPKIRPNPAIEKYSPDFCPPSFATGTLRGSTGFRTFSSMTGESWTISIPI